MLVMRGIGREGALGTTVRPGHLQAAHAMAHLAARRDFGGGAVLACGGQRGDLRPALVGVHAAVNLAPRGKGSIAPRPLLPHEGCSAKVARLVG